MRLVRNIFEFAQNTLNSNVLVTAETIAVELSATVELFV